MCEEYVSKDERSDSVNNKIIKVLIKLNLAQQL